MARIILGGIVSDIQGKIGGSVFQKSSSGLILRNSPAPIWKNSKLHNESNTITSSLQKEWQNLTNNQRQDWTNWTQFNPIKQKNISGRFINGQQAFIKINYYRIAYSKSLILNPIYAPFTYPQITASVSRSNGNLLFTTDDSSVSLYAYIILYLTTSVSPTINNAGNRFRLIKFTTALTGNQDITSGYTDIFGLVPDVANTLFIKYTIADNDSGIFHPFKYLKDIVHLIT